MHAMYEDYENVAEIVPEQSVKYGSCCNLWIEVPVDIGMDLELIRRRLRLAGFKDVTEYRYYSEDNMMLLIRTVISGHKGGVSEFDLKRITKATRQVADGYLAPLYEPPRILLRLEEMLRWVDDKNGDDTPATRRVLGLLYGMALHEFEFDERELLAAYIQKFQAALDHLRKRGDTPPDFTMSRVVSRIRSYWRAGDAGLFKRLLLDFKRVGTGGAEAREGLDPEPTEPEVRVSRGLVGRKTSASLESLRALLR